jgi:serine/threonine-protein kinase HipA
MSMPSIEYCPGTLAQGYHTYSRSCLRRMFNGSKVSHVLPYDSPAAGGISTGIFTQNQRRVSISGVQEKFSIIQLKNKLRLVDAGEQGTHILKPIPTVGHNADQMPANEHLTMQIARQVYGIETAESALIYFQNAEVAYITKRFDVNDQSQKRAVEDFAALAARSPQTHGEHYKYLGSYLDLFQVMKSYLPVYGLESLRLFKLIIFNYLFSNGDAHFKNFSIIETGMGDFRLSPAYDLLNSRLHVHDSDFALDDGLLPRSILQGNLVAQFYLLGKEAGLHIKQIESIFKTMLSGPEKVKAFVNASFLNERSKRNYLQAYQTRLKKMSKA